MNYEASLVKVLKSSITEMREVVWQNGDFFGTFFRNHPNWLPGLIAQFSKYHFWNLWEIWDRNM